MMNFKLFILIISIGLGSLLVQAQYHVQRNTVYGEFLGVSEFYSINGDHIINEFHHNSETIRAGISFRPGNSIYLNAGPNLMHGLKRQKDRYIEVGVGAVYKYEYTKGKATGEKYSFVQKSDAYGYFSVGYRKQGTRKDPMFWKVAFTPMIARGPFENASWLSWIMPSAGVSLGYSF
jgi:hypothetical protein